MLCDHDKNDEGNCCRANLNSKDNAWDDTVVSVGDEIVKGEQVDIAVLVDDGEALVVGVGRRVDLVGISRCEGVDIWHVALLKA